MIKVIPSKLELAFACQAATQRSIDFPFEESPASIRGNTLHEATAMVIQVGIENLDEVCKDLSDEDKACVKMAVEVANALKPRGRHKRYIEHKVKLDFLNMRTGKVDLAYYDYGSGSLSVIDHKFGSMAVTAPDDNKQLQAYALALVEELKKENLPVYQVYLAVSQPAKTVVDSYKWALFNADCLPSWIEAIKTVPVASSVLNAPATPGPHCKKLFCEAGKHGVCPEFTKWSGEKADEKKELSDRNAAFAVSGLLPVIVEGPSIQFPLVVLSEEAIAKAEDYRQQAQGLVLDQSSADGMGLLLNEITKFETQMVKNSKLVKKPLDDIYEQIDAARDRGLLPLREAKALAQKRLLEWKAAEDRKRLEAEMEANKAKAKAESEANAARIKREAAEKAAREATNAEARKKAEEEAAKQAAIQKAQQEAAKAASVPIPEAPKIAGTTEKKKPEFDIVDWDAMPDMFKVKGVETVLLKKAIEAKKVTEKDTWLKITWVDAIQSSGRRG